MIRILLLVDCANDFDRNLLRGIVRYSRENGPWLFYRLPSYYRSIENGERSILEWAKAWKADAIIGQWNDDAMDLLKELNIPVVLQNYRHRSTTYSNLTGDYEGTGLMAARFFAERLFRNFAFFGVKGVVWSDERCKGYRGEVERIGGTFHAFETGKDSEKSRMPRFTSWAVREPSGAKITAMSPELRKDTTHTTTDAPSTKRMQ